MADDNGIGSFTAEEQAYFNSGGRSPGAPPPERERPEREERPREEARTDDREQEAPEAREPAGDGEERGDGDRGDRRTVDHGAFHQERQRRKAAEDRARTLEAENNRAVARMEALLQEQQRQTAPQAPDPEQDLFEAVKFERTRREELEKRLQARDQQEHQARVVRQIETRYHQEAVAFADEQPDFIQAYNHLIESRRTELEAQGITGARQRQTMADEERQLAYQAMQRGQNPAEVIYRLAGTRGYRPQQASRDPSARLDRIEAGQAANKSLSGTGGRGSGGEVDARALIAMSESEFDEYQAKNPAKVKRLMGGP